VLRATWPTHFLPKASTYAKAEMMNRKLLAVQQRVVGPDHADTLGTTMNLATALATQGKYVKAETMYREVLAVRRRVLGSEHPDTLSTARNLASTLAKQGKHAEAETILRLGACSSAAGAGIGAPRHDEYIPELGCLPARCPWNNDLFNVMRTCIALAPRGRPSCWRAAAARCHDGVITEGYCYALRLTFMTMR
jgi:hypothetical protein